MQKEQYLANANKAYQEVRSKRIKKAGPGIFNYEEVITRLRSGLLDYTNDVQPQSSMTDALEQMREQAVVERRHWTEGIWRLMTRWLFQRNPEQGWARYALVDAHMEYCIRTLSASLGVRQHYIRKNSVLLLRFIERNSEKQDTEEERTCDADFETVTLLCGKLRDCDPVMEWF